VTPKHHELRAVVRSIFTIESLPPVDEASRAPGPTRGSGLARALLAAEPLPLDPEVRRPRRGLARMLFALEPLAVDPPAAPRRRARWLRWLFGTESLDP
jgi:hypothetical protein